MDITHVTLELKDDWWHMTMFSGQKQVYPRPGQQAERCRSLAAVAAMVAAAERFEDETSPLDYPGHGEVE